MSFGTEVLYTKIYEFLDKTEHCLPENFEKSMQIICLKMTNFSQI